MGSGATVVRAQSGTGSPAEGSAARRLVAGRAWWLIGGVTGVLGALLAGVANGLHPHPSDFHLEALLQEIAHNSAWPVVHLTLIFALVLVYVALVALALSIEGEPGAAIARVACVVTLLGGTLLLVSTAMDGFAMNQLAYNWVSAPAAEKATALRVADGFENAQYAIYSLSIVLFMGVGVFLYGLATVLSGAYPKALGWLAMLAGAGAFVTAVAQTLGGPSLRVTELFFVLFSFTITVWTFILGLLMWRKARAAGRSPASAEPARS